ncbi:MAG: carotenoid 1,2-hydratase [Gammaproteobacteria bacterium]|nr:carotenoid 1,2-hydratase [Gammaproteobacteria bacterium]
MAGPDFARPVAPGGYAWWYVDALSDDATHGITIIAFIGSVFSPYYAWARRRHADAMPEAHCAVNVAVYGPRAKRWAMTERGAGDLARERDRLVIGPSELHWDGNQLRIRFDEITMPVPSRLRGEIRVTPTALTGQVFALDAPGRHHWSPFAPGAHVEVRLEQPQLFWQGHGYFDGNFGDEPLEQGFTDWDWSRARLPDGSTAVLYEARARAVADERLLALHFGADGRVQNFAPPKMVRLPRSGWRVARATRAQEGNARVLRTLEDTPFYARSLLNTTLLGHEVTAMHESLSLTRFSQPIVQCMLPFRMPRRARR